MLKSRNRRRHDLLAVAGSLALHLALLAGVALIRAPGPSPVAPETVRPPIAITLIRLPPPTPVPEPRAESPAEGGAAPAPAAEPPPGRPAPLRPTPPRPAPPAARLLATSPADVAPVPAVVADPAPVFTTVSEARLAGAATAGSGAGQGVGAGPGTGPGSGPGGEGPGCDMIGRLQTALRADPEVRAAVAAASRAAAGRALLVWDGEWVRTPGQAGKGLAGLRQAIALEVAFAPEPCRRQPMRGLVLISFADGGRVVFGADRWSWSALPGR